MQLVKLITPKIIKTLHCLLLTFLVLLFTALTPVFSQDNSPYSRYGMGDLIPPLNIINRGMGGLSAGYNDYLSINFSNPASYSNFQTLIEPKSKKIISGRAILDIGVNVDARTLREPATAKKFSATNALFSYLQVGVPLKKNWGLNFGLRPVSRISYKMFRSERLINPIPPFNSIDSSLTRFEGSGGSYLASVGTGFALFSKIRKDKSYMEEKLSVGLNAGYMFGEKDYSTKRSLINDSVDYYQANYENKTNFGKLNFNAGLQYRVPVSKNILLTVGAYGSWAQKLSASQDVLRETFTYNANAGELRLDSVSDRRDVKGEILLPASYTIGFVLQKLPVINKEAGWLFGIDFEQQNWSKYRFYGQTDSVRNKWEVRVGAQLHPVPKRNYFSNVAYRLGFFTGPDYIKVGKNLPQYGVSFGMGLPLGVSRQAPNQVTIINMAFEYSKRGNNTNVLRENMFRVSFGFSLSDMWFGKRQYN